MEPQTPVSVGWSLVVAGVGVFLIAQDIWRAMRRRTAARRQRWTTET